MQYANIRVDNGFRVEVRDGLSEGANDLPRVFLFEELHTGDLFKEIAFTSEPNKGEGEDDRARERLGENVLVHNKVEGLFVLVDIFYDNTYTKILFINCIIRTPKQKGEGRTMRGALELDDELHFVDNGAHIRRPRRLVEQLHRIGLPI